MNYIHIFFISIKFQQKHLNHFCNSKQFEIHDFVSYSSVLSMKCNCRLSHPFNTRFVFFTRRLRLVSPFVFLSVGNNAVCTRYDNPRLLKKSRIQVCNAEAIFFSGEKNVTVVINSKILLISWKKKQIIRKLYAIKRYNDANRL